MLELASIFSGIIAVALLTAMLLGALRGAEVRSLFGHFFVWAAVALVATSATMLLRPTPTTAAAQSCTVKKGAHGWDGFDESHEGHPLRDMIWNMEGKDVIYVCDPSQNAAYSYWAMPSGTGGSSASEVTVTPYIRTYEGANILNVPVLFDRAGAVQYVMYK